MDVVTGSLPPQAINRCLREQAKGAGLLGPRLLLMVTQAIFFFFPANRQVFPARDALSMLSTGLSTGALSRPAVRVGHRRRAVRFRFTGREAKPNCVVSKVIGPASCPR